MGLSTVAAKGTITSRMLHAQKDKPNKVPQGGKPWRTQLVKARRAVVVVAVLPDWQETYPVRMRADRARGSGLTSFPLGGRGGGEGTVPGLVVFVGFNRVRDVRAPVAESLAQGLPGDAQQAETESADRSGTREW
jgi:hypothetical protein